MPVNFPNSVFELQNLDFLQSSVIKNSVSSKVHVFSDLLSFFEQFDTVDVKIKWLSSENMSIFLILKVNLRKSSPHLFG